MVRAKESKIVKGPRHERYVMMSERGWRSQFLKFFTRWVRIQGGTSFFVFFPQPRLALAVHSARIIACNFILIYNTLFFFIKK